MRFLLFLSVALAAQSPVSLQSVREFVNSKFPIADNRINAELPALSAHMETRYGKPNSSGGPESPRLTWIIRIPNNPMGNCVSVKGSKPNKNTAGVEMRISTGKCAMYAQEKLTIFE